MRKSFGSVSDSYLLKAANKGGKNVLRCLDVEKVGRDLTHLARTGMKKSGASYSIRIGINTYFFALKNT